MKHDRMRSVDIIFGGPFPVRQGFFPNASPKTVRQSRYCDTGLDYPFVNWQGKVRVSLAPFPCLLGDRRPHPQTNEITKTAGLARIARTPDEMMMMQRARKEK